MSLPHTLKGTIFLLFLLTYLTANAMNTPVSSFFQESQDNMVNDVQSVTMGTNLTISVPLIGSYEIPYTTGIMSFFNWIKLLFDTAMVSLGLLGVFYTIINIFPDQLIAPILLLGTIGIIFIIIAYISNLGRE